MDIKNRFSNNNDYLAVVNDRGLWIKEEIEGNIYVIPAEKFDKNTMKLISDIINETEFKESNIFNYKNINHDFINKQNIDKIWLLVKYYLMKKGFKNRYDAININLKAKEKGNLLIA